MVTTKSQMKAQACIVVYKDTSVEEDKSSTYCEIHPIDKSGNIGSGKPMTAELASNLGNSLIKGSLKLISGIIPPGLLSLNWNYEKPRIAWYTPAQKVKMLFTKDLGIKDGEYHVPALVWVYDQYLHSVAIYALADTKDLASGKAKLFRAPFHNVSASGSVCLGATAWDHINKFESFVEIMDRVMTAFWKSRFSHLTSGSPIKGNLNTLLMSLVNTDKPFPTEQLLPYRTIAAIL